MEAYEEIRFLGRGVFGEVALCRRRSDGLLCAVKRLQVSGDYMHASEPMQEVAVLQKLEHPGVLRYFGSVEENHCINIITEYADRGDLQHFLRDRLDSGVAVEAVASMAIFSQLATAVQHLHGMKVLHRDLKPSNVLLTSRGLVKLGDFGVAKVLAGTAAYDQMTCVGSPVYMAPEIVGGQPYGAPCDIWSLGVILYELCTLRKPFEGRSLGEMAMRILSGEYTPMVAGDAAASSSKNAALAELVQPLVARMLVLEARERADMGEVMRSGVLSLFASSMRTCRACVAEAVRPASERAADEDAAWPDRPPPQPLAHAKETTRVDVDLADATLPAGATFTPAGFEGTIPPPPPGEPLDGTIRAPQSPYPSAQPEDIVWSKDSRCSTKTEPGGEKLGSLSVKELKRRLKDAGGKLPPGSLEKPELVKALRDALGLPDTVEPDRAEPAAQEKVSAPSRPVIAKSRSRDDQEFLREMLGAELVKDGRSVAGPADLAMDDEGLTLINPPTELIAEFARRAEKAAGGSPGSPSGGRAAAERPTGSPAERPRSEVRESDQSSAGSRPTSKSPRSSPHAGSSRARPQRAARESKAAPLEGLGGSVRPAGSSSGQRHDKKLVARLYNSEAPPPQRKGRRDEPDPVRSPQPGGAHLEPLDAPGGRKKTPPWTGEARERPGSGDAGRPSGLLVTPGGCRPVSREPLLPSGQKPFPTLQGGGQGTSGTRSMPSLLPAARASGGMLPELGSSPAPSSKRPQSYSRQDHGKGADGAIWPPG